MAKFNDLSGKKFGYLTIAERVQNAKNGKARWKCICDCGNETIVTSTDIMTGHTSSCGCKRYESHNRVHGMNKTDIHTKWVQMRQRCYNKNDASYIHYGAKGVSVCDEWRNNFIAFMNWSYSNGYKEGLSLDRIDNLKGYYPDNCRWVKWEDQSGNRMNNIKITFNGKTQNLKKWCDELGKDYLFIRQRIIRDGMTFDEAISTPKMESRSHPRNK